MKCIIEDMEILKGDDGIGKSKVEITENTEHSLYKNTEAMIVLEGFVDGTGSREMVDAFLTAVGETAMVEDSEGKVMEYFETVDESTRSDLRAFISYVFEAGPTFDRKGEGVDDLIATGREKYTELAGVTDGIYDWTGEIAMGIMTGEIDDEREPRLQLLGALDAAREAGNEKNAREIKDILTSVLGLDKGDDPWLNLPEDKIE